MEEKLWNAANAVVGFAVLQAIAFLYAAAKGDLRLNITTSLFTAIALCVLPVICGCAYGFAVWRCYTLALRLDVEHKETWRDTTKGRIYAIAFFQLLVVVALVCLPYAAVVQH
jgi:hypothetical protein